MDSLEYIQQLQKLDYPLNLNEYEYDMNDLTDNDLTDKSDDLICEELSNYEENRMLFDKVLLSSDFPIEWKYAYRREIQEIIPDLFLGSYYSASKSKKNYLLKHGITSIVCIRNEYEAMWIKPQHKEFNYLTLNIDDTFTQDLIPFFELTNRFILDTLRNKGRVLIHSNAGISRCAAICCAFIMFYFKDCSSSNAIRFVQSLRYCSYPNENFRRQLKEYEPILMAQLKKPNSNRLCMKRSLSEDVDISSIEMR